ncbi:MAG TPA: CocE/NonD family hydrolase [Rhodocyclaceae bacterium]|nr:CocE/NonD family hydrolase [Rhodocyclaceae bacterium]
MIKLILSLVLLLSSLVSSAAENSINEKVLIPFRNYQIVTYIYRPKTGATNFPVVIFSHGRAASAEGRAKVDQPEQSILDFWLKRGFAVVAAVRPGYGATAGGDREVHGSRWVEGPARTFVCEGKADFLTVAEKSAEAVSKVIEWSQSQAWADRKHVLVVGQSVGGLATVALTTKQIDGVVGAINFAGGSGGDPKQSPGASCRPDVMAALYRSYGAKAAIPSLWLYSRNDQFWGETAPPAWHAAFAEGGSDTRFFHAPAVFNHDGHQLMLFGANYWEPEVDAFLRKLGLVALQ